MTELEELRELLLTIEYEDFSGSVELDARQADILLAALALAEGAHEFHHAWDVFTAAPSTDHDRERVLVREADARQEVALARFREVRGG